MMAEGVARRDAVAGAALAAGVAVVAPQAASARGANGKETGAFAADAYSKYQKGYPRNIAPVVRTEKTSVHHLLSRTVKGEGWGVRKEQMPANGFGYCGRSRARGAGAFPVLRKPGPGQQST